MRYRVDFVLFPIMYITKVKRALGVAHMQREFFVFFFLVAVVATLSDKRLFSFFFFSFLSPTLPPTTRPASLPATHEYGERACMQLDGGIDALHLLQSGSPTIRSR